MRARPFDAVSGGCYKLVHSFFTCGAVAQLGARIDGIDEVAGSNPAGSTNLFRRICVQLNQSGAASHVAAICESPSPVAVARFFIVESVPCKKQQLVERLVLSGPPFAPLCAMRFFFVAPTAA